MSVSVAGIPKNRCRTTVAERMGENASGTAPLPGTKSVCLGRDQAARSGPHSDGPGKRQDSLEDQLKSIRGRLGFSSGGQASAALQEKLADGLTQPGRPPPRL